MEPAGRASEPAGRVAEPAVREPEPAVRAPELAGRALEPGERALESARRVSGLAGRALMRALEPAERALESAGRPFEASWEARSNLGGPAGNSRGGHREREIDTEWSVPGMWWYHRSSSPTGPLPKKEKKNFDNDNENQRKFCRSGVGCRNLANHGIIRRQSVLFFPLSFCLDLSVYLSISLSRARTDTHACVRTCMRAYGHARAHMNTHARIRIRTRACRHAHLHRNTFESNQSKHT